MSFVLFGLATNRQSLEFCRGLLPPKLQTLKHAKDVQYGWCDMQLGASWKEQYHFKYLELVD